MITIVHGPMACGKTRNAERLRLALQCARIRDGFDARSGFDHHQGPIVSGDLVLTYEHPDRVARSKKWQPTDITRFLSFDQAMRIAEERSTTQHTPGPWTIVPYGDGDSLAIHADRSEYRVAFMATPGVSGYMPEIQASARLIAAAPDLLTAALLQEDAEKAYATCQTCAEGEDVYCAPCSDRFDKALNARITAITKARRTAK